jgi:membrane protein involved in colicin uptake
MSWIDPNSKLRDLLNTAEKIVEEDRKREFAAAEEIRLAAELKAKQEAEAKAAAELKAKQDAEAEAKIAAELKAKQEAAAKAAAVKKTTITCLKGKSIKKVTAAKPVCPRGYKKK